MKFPSPTRFVFNKNAPVLFWDQHPQGWRYEKWRVENAIFLIHNYTHKNPVIESSTTLIRQIWFFMSQSTIFPLYRDGSSLVEPVISMEYYNYTKQKPGELFSNLSWMKWDQVEQVWHGIFTALNKWILAFSIITTSLDKNFNFGYFQHKRYNLTCMWGGNFHLDLISYTFSP